MTAEKAIEILSNVGDINRCCAEDAEALDMAIKALEQTKWIPCAERLPKDGELILFSTKTDEVFEGRYCDDNTPLQWYSFCDDTFAWNNVVTAWMPLPKPYKAEREEEE